MSELLSSIGYDDFFNDLLGGLFKRRGDVARGDPPQVAHLGRVERPRAVHGAAIVPDHQVALVPAVRMDERRLHRDVPSGP